MKTEATHEQNAAQTTGVRLRNAREQLGLSQQAVAERLCLKVSTVRDIEEDNTSANLATTFLRGYIRSYARLVHLPEDDLLPVIEKQQPMRMAKVSPMQGYPLGKRRKKRDGWLMSFTWLVLFVVLGLTVAWWWQNHKVQQQEISTMADQSSAELNAAQSGGQSVALNTDAPAPTAQAVQPEIQTPVVAPQSQPVTVDSTSQHAVAAPAQTAADATSALPTGQADVVAETTSALVMNFNADCWLDVTDASGKKLFSGVQHKGGTLNLDGKAPYKLKIGAPAAVQIQYQGKDVDLSRFIKANQVARLTLDAE